MVHRDIVVIGGSAGALEMLFKVLARLQAPFPASVFVVLHVPPYARASLHQVLGRKGRLPALQPQDGAPIEHAP